MVEQNSHFSHSGFVRRSNPLENLLAEVGKALQVLDGSAQAGRPNPAGARPLNAAEQEALSPSEQQHAAGLMRINHVGEVCAQALYRGQAMFCRDPEIRDVLYHAADEEVDHLAWCRDRLEELNSRPSLMNPLWYVGSFSLGVMASRAGIPRNLGFMAETERQVEQHLDDHLERLPPQDEHRTTAENHGAVPLPAPVKLAMRLMSKVMTTTAYRI